MSEATLRRHPRSYKQVGHLWDYVRLGDDRKEQVKHGRSLFHVNDAVKKKAPTVERPRRRKKEPQRNGKKSVTILGTTISPAGPVPTAKAFDHHFSDERDTRLHFGATVAFQSIVNNEVMVVRNSSEPTIDGKIGSCSVHRVGLQDVAKFKMIELNDPGSFKAVRFGDHIWLQIFGGTGEPSWRQGSVIGAKVYEATSLPTVSLDPRYGQQSTTVQADHHQRNLGQPAPVRATLPKGKEDAAWSYHEMRMRNSSAMTLGRWRIMPATTDSLGGFVSNFDEVFLEQDFFYICQDGHNDPVTPPVVGVAIPGGVPPAAAQNVASTVSSNSSTSSSVMTGSINKKKAMDEDTSLTFHRIPKENDGKYSVERRGIFRIRIAEASTDLREMSKGEQRSEMLMERARRALQRSDARRHGARRYRQDGSVTSLDKEAMPNPFPDSLEYIPGGGTFSMYLRESIKARFADRELAALRTHVRKEARPHAFFAKQFPGVGAPKPIGLGISSESSSLDDGTCTYCPRSPTRDRPLVINRYTTQSLIKFPTKRSRPEKPLGDLLESPSLVSKLTNPLSPTTTTTKPDEFDVASLAVVSPAQERKSRLLSSAASWPLAFNGEDDMVAQQVAKDLRCGRADVHRDETDEEPDEIIEEDPDDDKTDEGTVTTVNTEEEDDNASIATAKTLKTIDHWHARWMHKVAGATSIERRLAATDDLIVNNILFVKRRENFNAMLRKLDVDDETGTAIRESWHIDGPTRPSPLTETSLPTLSEEVPRGEDDDDTHVTFSSTADEKDLPIFAHDESLACFRGDDALLDRMARSTAKLLDETIVPKLRAAMDDDQESLDTPAIVRVVCETILLVLTFTECIIAPRLRAIALRIKNLLSDRMLSGDANEDEELVEALCENAQDVDLQSLMALTRHMLADITDFVSEVQ